MGKSVVNRAKSEFGSPEQEGDPEKDPALWLDAYGDYLFRYALVRVKSRELAEDLVQETLLAGVKAFDGFEGRSTVRTWLVGILKNKIIDNIRRASTRESREVLTDDAQVLDQHFNSLGIWNRVLSNWASDPNQHLEQKQFYAQLERCLDKVPEKSRQAFVLKNFENVESTDICKILDVTSSNLWVLLHRCRLSLRDCLEKNWIEKQ